MISWKKKCTTAIFKFCKKMYKRHFFPNTCVKIFFENMCGIVSASWVDCATFPVDIISFWRNIWKKRVFFGLFQKVWFPKKTLKKLFLRNCKNMCGIASESWVDSTTFSVDFLCFWRNIWKKLKNAHFSSFFSFFQIWPKK